MNDNNRLVALYGLPTMHPTFVRVFTIRTAIVVACRVINSGIMLYARQYSYSVRREAKAQDEPSLRVQYDQRLCPAN